MSVIPDDSLTLSSDEYKIVSVDGGLFYFAVKKEAKAAQRTVELDLPVNDADGALMYYLSTKKPSEPIMPADCKPVLNYIVGAAAGALIAGAALFAITKMNKKL